MAMHYEQVHLVTFDTPEEEEVFRQAHPRVKTVQYEDGRTAFISCWPDIYQFEEKEYKSKIEHFESKAHWAAHKLCKEVLNNRAYCIIFVKDGRIQLHVTQPAAFWRYKNGYEGIPVDIVKGSKPRALGATNARS